MEIYTASIMDTVKSIVTGEFFLIPVVGAALLAIFKVIPNDKIKFAVGAFATGAGKALTLGAANWKWSKHFWNGIVEPWFIDLLENVVQTFVDKFVAALRSDNGE